MSKYIVGLTGGIASGKTTVSDHFASLGIDIVDADVVAREVVARGSTGLQQIQEKFGEDVLLANGKLDRAKLRTLVFSNEEYKNWLNALLHPLIRERMQELCERATSAYCILSVPLLIENGLDAMVNRTLVVDIDESTQLQRAIQRDASSESTIKNIMAAQATRKQRLEKADDLIRNDQDLEWLKKQVNTLHEKYMHVSLLQRFS
jgi:dephospho-CoA kinase